jgi:hypothetical protein
MQPPAWSLPRQKAQMPEKKSAQIFIKNLTSFPRLSPLLTSRYPGLLPTRVARFLSSAWPSMHFCELIRPA